MTIASTGTIEMQGVASAAADPSEAALRHLDLRVEAGEFVALTGPRGCGKSKLLHLLAGFEPLTSGALRLSGLDLHSMSAGTRARVLREQLGLVFPSLRLIEFLSVLENVGMPVALAGFDSAQVEKCSRQSLSRAGLTDGIDRRPAQLDAEEKVRLAIARALAFRPAILLADEPTETLTPLAGQRIVNLLRGLVRTQGITLVLATEKANIACHADREVQMRDGRLHEAGTFAEPGSSRAA